MSIKVDGLDQLKAKFKKLSDTNSISFTELFPDDFITEYTKAENLDDFFSKSGFKVKSAEDFSAIPDEPWEKYIIANTQFQSWTDMQKAAYNIWIKKHLGIK